MGIERLFKEKEFVMSAEVFPPKKNGELEGVIRALKGIKSVSPDFVSVTYGASGTGGDKTNDVASVIIDAFDMEAVAHITAVNMTVEKLEETLQVFLKKNVQNIMVLRGDIVEDSKFFDFHYASDLATYIKSRYPKFTLLGGCYPDGHYQAPSIEQDIENLKIKLDAGVEHLITQLFFDNDTFYRFMDMLAARGINTPVSAGIMPVTNVKQINRLVSMCGAQIPKRLANIVANQTSDDMYRAGLDYAIEQISDLHAHGVSGVHVYTMNKTNVAVEIFETCAPFRK